MLYLAVGAGLGPAGWALLSPDPLLHSHALERAAEVAVLISLFAVGLKLGLPLSDKRWRLPLRLASAVDAGHHRARHGHRGGWPDLSWGAAVLLQRSWPRQIRCSRRTSRFWKRMIGTACASVFRPRALQRRSRLSVRDARPGLLGLHDLGVDGGRWLALDVSGPLPAASP